MKRSGLFNIFQLVTLFSLIFSLAGTIPVLAKVEAATKAELTFSELGLASPKILSGPASEYALTFNLPVNWQPGGNASIKLEFSAFFSSLVPTESTAAISGLIGGELSVTLNGVPLAVKTLQESGAQSLELEFDTDLLLLPARENLNELRIRWDGSVACQMNLLSSLTILPTSTIKFSYTESSRTLSLNDFPVPFVVENSVRPVSLAVILPESPSLAEIQAGLIIVAGLGQLSQGRTDVQILSLAEYLALSKIDLNIIVVANTDHAASSAFEPLDLPTLASPAPGEGMLQFLKSSAASYGILVSGDDEGIIKAAQVLSAKQIAASGDGLAMVVSAVNDAAPAYDKENITLDDLGVGEILLSNQNGLVQSFDFLIPAGDQARPDASFKVILSHSQQLDYLRSGLQIKLNGYPAISFRLMDSTSNQAVFTVILPSNLIRSGKNRVELIADLKTRDLCTPPLEAIAWIRVSAKSTLHIPLESAVPSKGAPKTFGDFPNAFLSGSGFDNLIFLISAADFEHVKAAGVMAFDLGAALPQPQPLQLRVISPDTFDLAVNQEANLILVGQPLDFTILDDKQGFPSLVFNSDNTLSETSGLTTVIKPAANASIGYLAIRGYSAQSNRILLAVLGNNPAAVQNAVNKVTNREIRTNNFAYVVEDGTQTSWLDQGIAYGGTASTSAQPTSEPSSRNTAQKFQQDMLSWVIPVLIILVALLVVFVYVEIRQQFRKD